MAECILVLLLVVAAPLGWYICALSYQAGYRAGNDDGLNGWRSEGLIVRRMR